MKEQIEKFLSAGEIVGLTTAAAGFAGVIESSVVGRGENEIGFVAVALLGAAKYFYEVAINEIGSRHIQNN